MENNYEWTIVCYKKKKPSTSRKKVMNIVSQPLQENNDDYLPVPSCYKCKTNIALGY